MHRINRRKITFGIVQGAVLVLVAMLASSTQAAAPKGNSGTVKIDGVEFEDHRANEPHPSCDFRVTFFGYGEGREATATFALVAPTKATSGPGTVSSGPIDVGQDPAGGGNDPDGAYEADLASFLEESGATPHPKQGYHVKLTVNAPGSQGADVKHKVFWVTCSTDVGGTRTDGDDDDADVLGTRETRSDVLGTRRTRQGGLATTALPIGWTSVAAAEMLLLGAAMVIGSRRRSLVTAR